MSLVITGDEEIRELNRRYQGEDRATDVLSFPLREGSPLLSEGKGVPFIQPPGQPRSLGEVIISYPRAVEQAKEYGHTLEGEVALLAVHGLLHLLGYDHADAQGQSSMRAEETSLLQALGYASPALAKHYTSSD